MWLFAVRPEWLKLARGKEHEVEGLSVFTLEVNFPSQNRSIFEPLTLDVDLHRILTVWWFPHPDPKRKGRRWDHDLITYTSPLWERLAEQGQKRDVGFQLIFDLIEALMGEEVVAFSTGHKDGGGSYGIRKASEANLPADTNSAWFVQRSWLGTFDRVEGQALEWIGADQPA